MTTTECLKLFNPRLSSFGQLCIAGGAVRDELMGVAPKDFDLFCLCNGDWDFKDAKEQLSGRLDGLSASPPTVEWHKSEPYLVATIIVNGQQVQILANPAGSIEELISTFDWNVCLFARTETEIYQQTAIEDIAVGKELKLNKVTFPLSTLRRGFRFSERFTMKLRNEDVHTLCGAILEKSKKGMGVGPEGNEPDMPSLEANTLVQ